MVRRVGVVKTKKGRVRERSETTRFSLKGVAVILRHDDAKKYFWRV